MTDSKIIAILNKIRDDGDLSYQNAVPKLNEGDLLYVYGASILGNPHIKNQFLNAFMNFFMYEETKQHIFESEFDRLKNPSNVNRYGSFEAFRNTIKPMNYDESALDRILKLYKPDVKTAYFARNRQDIFPMSIARQELETAFMDYAHFDSFVTGLYEQLTNSNRVVEYNAIKECINVNVQGGAIKTVTIPTIDSTTAPSIAKMIRSYVTRMQKPSTKYNAYIDMEGAVGDPVETQCPKESLLLIADADTIAEISIDVLASAFNLAYADFEINLIEVDDFGYNVYDRATRTVIGRHESNIKFLICDEALFKIEDNLDVTAEGQNDVALVKQTFYHIWQTIQVRPWANAVAFCYAENTAIDIVSPSNTVFYNAPVELKFTPAEATIESDTVLKASNGTTITATAPSNLAEPTVDLAEIAYKVTQAVKTITKIDTSTPGKIVVTRTSNKGISAGTYDSSDVHITLTEDEMTLFTDTYGIKTYALINFHEQGNEDNGELVLIPVPSKSVWNS